MDSRPTATTRARDGGRRPRLDDDVPPDTAAQPGRWRCREFEYIRHGTASLHAALDVQSEQILAKPIP